MWEPYRKVDGVSRKVAGACWKVDGASRKMDGTYERWVGHVGKISSIDLLDAISQLSS